MAPALQPFPVTTLPEHVLAKPVDFKPKSRKLPRNFSLGDCELLELVQYSCTTHEQQYRRALQSPTGMARMECFPFVRLFRRCGEGARMFHVETTAWEGEHAWKGERQPDKKTTTMTTTTGMATTESQSSKATVEELKEAGYFWSKK